MKRQADRERRKVEIWKVGDKIILSTKDLVFKKQPAKKLVDQYIGPYIIDKFYQCNQIIVAHFNKDLFGSKHQLSSVI